MCRIWITFASPDASSRVRKRFQAIKIDNHRSGLVKRANHVFAKGMVDGGLPAHGRINLRQ